MMLNPYVIIGALVASVAIFFGGVTTGYKYKTGEVAERDLAVKEQQQKDDEKFAKRESNIAAIVEQKIADLSANQTTREIQREIVKPVFRNVCASDDYVRMFNSRLKAEREASTAKPAD